MEKAPIAVCMYTNPKTSKYFQGDPGDQKQRIEYTLQGRPDCFPRSGRCSDDTRLTLEASMGPFTCECQETNLVWSARCQQPSKLLSTKKNSQLHPVRK
jgi:hypothetical protein